MLKKILLLIKVFFFVRGNNIAADKNFDGYQNQETSEPQNSSEGNFGSRKSKDFLGNKGVNEENKSLKVDKDIILDEKELDMLTGADI